MTDGLLFKSLIKKLRELDASEGRDLLKRFLSRPQEQADATAERIRSLALTDSPVTCREDLLQYLKNTVGLTKGLDNITSRLTTRNLRRLISMAVPLWQRRGTVDGLAVLIRFLTGRSMIYTDWFQYRNILGESAIGEGTNGGWLIGGEVTAWDEYISTIRLMDDGTLDAQLLTDIISMCRPNSERIEVMLLDFLDVFDGKLDRWNALAGAPSIVSGVMALPPDASVVASIPSLGSQYVFEHSFKMSEASGSHMASFWRDGVNFYNVSINPGVTFGSTGQISTQQVAGGVWTDLPNGAHDAPCAIVPGAWYAVRIEANNVGGGVVHIRVYLDNSLVIDVADTPPFAPQGPVGLWNTGLGTTEASNAWVMRTPYRRAVVGPGGVEASSNFMSP